MPICGRILNLADPSDAGFRATTMKAAGLSLADRKDAAFSATDVEAASFSLIEVKAASISLADQKAASSCTADLKAAGSSLADTTAASSSKERRPQPTTKFKSTVRRADRPPQKFRSFCEMGGAVTAADSSITDPKDSGHSALKWELQASQCRADDGGIGFKAKTFGLESGSNRRDTEPSGANPPGSGRWETWGSRGSAHAHGATRHMG